MPRSYRAGDIVLYAGLPQVVVEGADTGVLIRARYGGEQDHIKMVCLISGAAFDGSPNRLTYIGRFGELHRD